MAARQLGSRIPGHVAFAIIHVREIGSDRPQELMVTATVDNAGTFRMHLYPCNLDMKRVIAEKIAVRRWVVSQVKFDPLLAGLQSERTRGPSETNLSKSSDRVTSPRYRPLEEDAGSRSVYP